MFMKILIFILKMEMLGLLIGEGMIQCMNENAVFMHVQTAYAD